MLPRMEKKQIPWNNEQSVLEILPDVNARIQSSAIVESTGDYTNESKYS